MSYSIVKNEKEFARAMALCKGSYQVGILTGREALSGATLKGKAKSYGGRYAQSAKNLLSRMTDNGISWHEEIGPHNKRILVIG